MKEKPKILVVDDEEDFCFFVRENLLNSGEFDVVIAVNGRRGIQLARSEMPDLILLDLMMPDLSGEKVAETLGGFDETRNIPIIFLTALITKEDAGTDPLKRIGDSYFIAKPVRTKALISAIKQRLMES